MSNSISKNPRDESVFGRLSSRTRATLDALLRAGVADKALAEVENEQLSERAKLAAQLKELQVERSAALPRAEAAAIKACQEFEVAEAAFMRARDRKRDAQLAVHGAERQFEARCNEINRALALSADPRLAEFAWRCQQLIENDLVKVVVYKIDVQRSSVERRTVQYDNVKEAAAAKAALRAVMAAAQGSMLEPLGYIEVSQRLMGWCEEVAKPLAAVELNPPSLTAADAEVGAPVQFNGTSRWVVDQLYDGEHEMRPKTAAQIAAEVRHV